MAASRTSETITALHPTTDKGKLMGALLVGNSQIDAGLAPLGTMGGNPAPAMAMLGKKVGQFVKQCLLHLIL